MSFARRLLAIAAVLLLVPVAVYAASEINVEDVQYKQEDHPEGVTREGSGGGSWTWDGQDELTLTDYVGGPIEAAGDLNVILEGENKVSNPDEYSIQAKKDDQSGELGNLTFQGEGSLSAEGSIFTQEGYIVFDGVDVTVSADELQYYAVSAGGAANTKTGANISILNGSNIDASYSYDAVDEDHLRFFGAAIWSAGAGDNPGSILIENSTVSARSHRDGDFYDFTREGYLAMPSVGLVATSIASDGTAPSIVIKDSTVNASGDEFSILATRVDSDWAPAPKVDGESGVIRIEGDSTIVSPSGARIQDIYVDQIIEGYVNNRFLNGQTIGFGTETITTVLSEDAVKDVLIDVPHPEPAPLPEPAPDPEPVPAAPAAPATVLPKTADATLVTEAALSASGGLLALATLIRRRRRS